MLLPFAMLAVYAVVVTLAGMIAYHSKGSTQALWILCGHCAGVCAFGFTYALGRPLLRPFLAPNPTR